MEVYENRVQRKMFGPKRYKVIDDWGKLHSEDLQDLYSSTVGWLIKKKNKMGGACGTNVRER
jgi:hypothetical protein